MNLLVQRSLVVASLATFAACAARPQAHTSAAVAPPDVRTGGPARCLPLANIERSEIVDDETILFHMLDGSIWRNRLPRRCYGLRFQGGFAYETSIDQLCDLDLIHVLPPTRGTCGLGPFEPYTHGRVGRGETRP